ncbi:hypothetical protein FGO68_gene517 [Halteria grandinella]|uniref:Uncharacterized protein n=1 Tax=Halteria grandinella TaxID=5974 RepID=A0A8J8NXX7_HALGN|nr:hypothetical protein FGO68_gene517 [Halteria grandinella]
MRKGPIRGNLRKKKANKKDTKDDGSSSSSSYNGSDLYDYKLPDEKKAKKHKKNKTEYGKLERMGVFKRLEIDPVPLLQMEPYAQELLVQRKIGNDLKPEQIQQMIVTSNIQATKIVNILNELEDMGMERHDFQTGYYSYQPKIDRKRLRLMKNDHVIHEAEQHPDDIEADAGQAKIDEEAKNKEDKAEANRHIEKTLEMRKQLYMQAGKAGKQGIRPYVKAAIAQLLLSYMHLAGKEGLDLNKVIKSNAAAPGGMQDIFGAKQQKMKHDMEKLKELKRQQDEEQRRELENIRRNIENQNKEALKLTGGKESMRVILESSKFGQPLAESGINLPPKVPRKSRNTAHGKSQSMAVEQLSQMKSKIIMNDTIAEQDDEDGGMEAMMMMPGQQKSRNKYGPLPNQMAHTGKSIAYSKNDVLRSQQFITLKKPEESKKTANPLSKSTDNLILPKVGIAIPPQARESEVEMPVELNKWGRLQMNDNDVALVKPTFDASNKQIFFKNKFRTNAGNMMQFLETKGVEAMREEVFRPRYLGDMSGTVLGPIVNISCAPDNTNQDFALSYLNKNMRHMPPKIPANATLPQIAGANPQPNAAASQNKAQHNRQISELTASKAVNNENASISKKNMAKSVIDQQDHGLNLNGLTTVDVSQPHNTSTTFDNGPQEAIVETLGSDRGMGKTKARMIEKYNNQDKLKLIFNLQQKEHDAKVAAKEEQRRKELKEVNFYNALKPKGATIIAEDDMLLREAKKAKSDVELRREEFEMIHKILQDRKEVKLEQIYNLRDHQAEIFDQVMQQQNAKKDNKARLGDRYQGLRYLGQHHR